MPGAGCEPQGRQWQSAMKDYSPLQGRRPDKFSRHTESLNKRRLPEAMKTRALKWKIRRMLLVRLCSTAPGSLLYALLLYVLKYLDRFFK
ncbi:MAG: hypothetical protein D6710_11805, partial [Nitrospirae bacterium]